MDHSKVLNEDSKNLSPNPRTKKMKNEFSATKDDTEIKLMKVDTDMILKMTCTKLIKRFEKKGFIFG